MTVFSGRQDAMVDLLRRAKDKDAKETLSGLLSALLKQSLDLAHDFLAVGNNKLGRANDGLGNRWGIRNMHGNVAEWVLPTEGADAKWKALLNEDSPNGTKALVRGGHFRHGGLSVISEEKWLALTIGHRGAEKSYDEAAKNQVEYSSLFAGIRLVMTREADPVGWLARLRKEVADGPLPAKTWLDGLDAGLKQIEEVDKAEATKANKPVAYLRGQYLTRLGDRAGAVDAVAKVTGDTPDEKLFLGALGRVMKADAAKK